MVSIMNMIRNTDGTRLLNPRYIREIRITSDEDGVMRYIVAHLQGGDTVELRKVNTYEMVGAEAYTKRQFELIEEAMSNV